MKTTQAKTVEQLDKLLTIVDRNQFTFRRYGGEVNRHRVLQAQAEATRIIEALGQSGLNKAGYGWRTTSAATLNAALEKRAASWRKEHDKSKGFANPVVVKGGAL